MPLRSSAAAPTRHLLAIALASFAVLFFQIAATRVLSVVLWYHWAFLTISLAMLGLGAPGVWFALRTPSPRLLPLSLVAGGLALPVSIVAVLTIACSALAGVASLALAMTFGFAATAWIGVAGYVAAGWFARGAAWE